MCSKASLNKSFPSFLPFHRQDDIYHGLLLHQLCSNCWNKKSPHKPVKRVNLFVLW